MPKTRGKKRKSTIRILEQSLHILRVSPAATLSRYYIGTLPFVLSFLYFWQDMSRSSQVSGNALTTSLVCALAFVWMKVWQAVFAAHIMDQLRRTPARHWSFGRIRTLTATQTLIHSTAFFLLPPALLLIGPFGWCYAFYQNITVFDDGASLSVRALCKKAWHMARLWPRQNHFLLAVFGVLGVIVWCNLAITVYYGPHLLKTLTGISSMFTIGGAKALNTTFLIFIFGLSYLCLDPIVKTAYTLRCFYGLSVETGQDIRMELSDLIAGKKVALLFIFLILAAPSEIAAKELDLPRFENNVGYESYPHGKLTPARLNHAIETGLQRKVFTWRLPREIKQLSKKKKTGPLITVIKDIMKFFSELADTLNRWLMRIGRWLKVNNPEKKQSAEESEKSWVTPARATLVLLSLVLAAVLIKIGLKAYNKASRISKAAQSAAVPEMIQPFDEETPADKLPFEEWLLVAKNLLERKALRLSLRAFYLATLAWLAEHERITIKRYKSNLDYVRELDRRFHSESGLPKLFSRQVALFEHVWYGHHQVTLTDINEFKKLQERIMSFVKAS